VPLERAIAAADGIDYIESSSKLGVSTITVRLKINYEPTKALAQISSRVDQVRRDLPPEAEIPTINVESADSRFASAYLSSNSKILARTRSTDYLVRNVQPRLTALSVFRKPTCSADARSRCAYWLSQIASRHSRSSRPDPSGARRK